MKTYYLDILKKNGLSRDVMSRFDSDDEDEGYYPKTENIKFEELTY